MKRLILLTAIVLLPILAMAALISTESVNFQGRLTDNSGNNVPDGNYTMIFGIYDAPTGGNHPWAETSSVAVSGGVFNHIIGSVNPLNKDFWGGVQGVDPLFLPYLELVVNGEVLSPRITLTYTPASLKASRVRGDIETGPGEILFQGVGGAPDLPGIIFQDTSTGDTLAQYGPGEVVFVGVGGTPDVANYGLDGFLHNSPSGSGFVTIQDNDGAPDDGVVDRTDYKLNSVQYLTGQAKWPSMGREASFGCSRSQSRLCQPRRKSGLTA